MGFFESIFIGVGVLKIVEWGVDAIIKNTRTKKDDEIYDEHIKPIIENIDIVLTAVDRIKKLFGR